jgi:cyclophilin family peptidyl-prolyl cis-trans isomerase
VLEALQTAAPKAGEDVRKIIAATARAIIQPGEGDAPSLPEVQAAAVALLAIVDPEQFQALLPALRLSTSWPVRAAAAAGLAVQKPHPPTAWVRRFLMDPDRRVRIAQQEGLASRPSAVEVDAFWEAVMETLGSQQRERGFAVDDPVEAATVASVFGAFLEARASPQKPESRFNAPFETFVKTVSRQVPEHEVEALQSVMDLAGKLKSDAGNQILRGYLRSPEISLRKRARDLLSKNGVDAKEGPPADAAQSERLLAACLERSRRMFANPVPSAVIETNRGNIVIRLFAADAPATVENFLKLARSGFYDGILWHRVVPAFVAQAGCPRGDGWGGPGYTIRCEVNDRTYRRGSIGMALAGKDTGGSQFFICHRALPHLDGRYTLFGQVAEGMDVVDMLTQDDYIVRIRVT